MSARSRDNRDRGTVKTVTGSYVVQPEDETIAVANNATAVTITLPNLTAPNVAAVNNPTIRGTEYGRKITIKRAPTAPTGPASTGAITIAGGALQSIEPLTIFTGFTATTSLGLTIGQRGATFQAIDGRWHTIGLR